MYKWSKDLETGNAKIDQQHMELIKALNELYRACMDRELGKVKDTANFFKNYVTRHFSDEEKLMRDSAYGKLDMHIKLHEIFKQQLGAILEDVSKEPENPKHLATLSQKGVSWLLNHIKVEDVQVARHIRAQQ